MKKRFWSLLLVFSMVFCLLLPFGAFAQEQDRGADCYAFLKNYLCSDGERPYPSPPPLPWVEKRQWYAGKCLTAHWRHLWSVNTPARANFKLPI